MKYIMVNKKRNNLMEEENSSNIKPKLGQDPVPCCLFRSKKLYMDM